MSQTLQQTPGSGHSPMTWDYWIGQKAAKDYDVDELIQQQRKTKDLCCHRDTAEYGLLR